MLLVYHVGFSRNLCRAMLRSIFGVDIFHIVFPLFAHFDSIKPFPDIAERNIKGCEAQTNIIRGAEVRDNVHLFDHRPVDAIAFLVANTDVGAASGKVTRGAERKAQWRKQLISQKGGVVRHQYGFGRRASIPPRARESAFLHCKRWRASARACRKR